MKIKRRDFVKLAGTGCLTLLAGDAIAKEGVGPSEWENAYGVLVDTTVCVGCRQCEWACKKTNFDPNADKADFEDKSVFKKHRRPDELSYTVVNEYHDPAKPEAVYTMKVQCMHCNEPACVSGCIVGALEKTKDGPVIYDAWKCIGCRYCIVACPFQVPAYEYDNALTPQVRKCTLCFNRLKEGKKPACVEACPTEALTFGTRGKLLELAHSKIKAHPDRYEDHIYGEHEIGGTSWLYLTTVDFKNTELPELPSYSIPPKTEKIQHGIFKWFIPPIAFYGLLGLIMYSKENNKNKQKVEK